MSSTAQTVETHAEEPSKSHASPPQPAPPPAPPLQSSHTSCRSSENEAGKQLIKLFGKGKVEEAKNVFLSPRAAPIPPPFPPHVFEPRPESAQFHGPSRPPSRFSCPSRSDIDLDFASTSFLNEFNGYELLRERTPSKKRGVVRCAPKAPSHQVDFQAKPEDGEAVDFGELIDFSDVEFDIGEDDGAGRDLYNFGTDRRGLWDTRKMSPSPQGRLEGPFTGGFDAGNFNEDQWEHDSGVLGTEAMPTFTNHIDDDERDMPRTRRVPGMIEAGIAQSREDEFGTAWFGGQERHVRSDRSVPGGLIELARRRDGGDDEEERSVGATRYMVDEVHHQNMVRALKGKPSLTSKVEVQSASTTNTGSVERNLKEPAEVEESAEAWKQRRSKRMVSRIPVAVRSRPA